MRGSPTSQLSFKVGLGDPGAEALVLFATHVFDKCGFSFCSEEGHEVRLVLIEKFLLAHAEELPGVRVAQGHNDILTTLSVDLVATEMFF